MRHDEAIRFRISGDLRRELEQAAAASGETLSAYARQAALAHARHRDPDTDRQLLEVLIQIRRSLGKVGNNLNQVAKRLHSGGQIPDTYSEQFGAEITKIQSAVAEALSERRRAL